ncbi:MAG: hypothetical protein JWL83_415 [Actinomycetia bacterium]|jgi:carbon monoxide dehydrogenase subunit G|nr:hypothetical protein [Actinomycetes bacterium]
MDFTHAIEVAVDADTAFAYVGNVEKLPQYLPRIVHAERNSAGEVRVIAKVPDANGAEHTAADDAWVKVLPDRRLEWGALSSDYRGEVTVSPTDHGARVMVTLHSDHGDREAINRDLAEALQTIKARLEH